MSETSNREFWNELCGSGLAKSLGITDSSLPSLARFDAAYFDFYPYLKSYFDALPSGKILEIGLGYGTASSYLAKRCESYHGLDISPGPVEMVNHRLKLFSMPELAQVGSAHSLPFNDGTFDAIVSIGCFHHTGSVKKCIDEAYRALKEGGILLFMCYNKNSFRTLREFPFSIFFRSRQEIRLTDDKAVLYDANLEGECAPFTEVSSSNHYRKLCSNFSSVSIHKENWDYPFRDKALNTVAKFLGLDLYVTCKK